MFDDQFVNSHDIYPEYSIVILGKILMLISVVSRVNVVIILL